MSDNKKKVSVVSYYKTAIRSFNGEDRTPADIADKVKELFPEFVENKHNGINQIKAEIGSAFITKMSYEHEGYIANRKAKPKMMVRYDSNIIDDTDDNDDNDDNDEQYDRNKQIEISLRELSDTDVARLKGFKEIARLISIAGLKLDIDHAKSLRDKGKEHPDNLHFLTSSHNRKKNKKSVKRMTYKEQHDYITDNIKMEIRTGGEIDKNAITVYMKMLKAIY